MDKITKQIEVWRSQFGKDYTDRCNLNLEQVNTTDMEDFGTTRTEKVLEFIGELDRSTRILEVGCNVGNQLMLLQHLGFESLYGIELQKYAVEESKKKLKNVNIIQGSAFDIPYKDDFFGLVFTSQVLIHIAPSDIRHVINEIHRTTSKYIWGFEYYAEEYEEVEYRGNQELLWKTNFARLYQEYCPNLKMLKERKFKYLHSDNVDLMFLLEKV